MASVAGGQPPRVLVVNTADTGGGAELTSSNLFRGLRRRGHQMTMAVGRKKSSDSDVVLIPRDEGRSRWARFWIEAGDRLEPLERLRGGVRIRDCAYWASEPARWVDIARGREDFHYPGTWALFNERRFDVVHCFNLHGGYFDLRVLPSLSQRGPVILDLCDAWLLAGHCAHSLGCDRWRTGCGHCPDLDLYPAVRRDGTAFNWRRKQQLFARSSLYVTAPSHWLMGKVGDSMLAPGIRESRVIPTGVDRTIFHPGAKARARVELGLPLDATILLFVANAIRRNPYKDYATVADAAARLGQRPGARPLLLLALGDSAPPARIGDAELRFVPHLDRLEDVAVYYRAADVYLHAAHADTFPRVILEALACGVPVVATGVGGIPEQIRTLGTTAPTGVVVPAGDARAMAHAVEQLVDDDLLRSAMAENAARDAASRFDLEQQVDAYVDWYQEIIENRAARPASAARRVS